MEAALGALETAGLALGVARSAPLYAAVSALHVLGIGLLLGPILIVDLHLLGVLRGLEAPALRLLRRAAAWGVLLALATGLLLLAARPFEYAGNGAMQAKLAVVALAALHALALEWRWHQAPGSLQPGRGITRLGGAASLALWLAALALGRWVAFA